MKFWVAIVAALGLHAALLLYRATPIQFAVDGSPIVLARVAARSVGNVSAFSGSRRKISHGSGTVLRKNLETHPSQFSSPGKSDELIDSNELFRLGNKRPEYPRIAVESGWEGTVLIKLSLSENGSVKDVAIAESSGYQILDESAVTAAMGWRLANYRAEEVRVPIRFALVP